MKLNLILYISKVKVNLSGTSLPLEISQICRVARKNNSEFGVTGILSFSRGHYLQVIEGEATAVQQLFSVVVSDKRHGDIQTLLDVEIQERFFSKSHMRLIGSVNQDPIFQFFMQNYQTNFAQLSKERRRALSLFYDDRSSKHIDYFDGKSLKILGWPDFAAIQQTPSAIELCARLLNSYHQYSDLVASDDFGTKAQIDSILRVLKKKGLLVVIESQVSDQKRPVENTGNRFYTKMKNFLTSR